jgi:hypothetical protein
VTSFYFPRRPLGSCLVFLNQVVGPLETRDNALQRAIASPSVRFSSIEARNCPCCNVRTIDDWNDDDTQDIHAIEGAQFGDDQLRDFVFLFLAAFPCQSTSGRHFLLPLISQRPLATVLINYLARYA